MGPYSVVKGLSSADGKIGDLPRPTTSGTYMRSKNMRRARDVNTKNRVVSKAPITLPHQAPVSRHLPNDVASCAGERIQPKPRKHKPRAHCPEIIISRNTSSFFCVFVIHQPPCPILCACCSASSKGELPWCKQIRLVACPVPWVRDCVRKCPRRRLHGEEHTHSNEVSHSVSTRQQRVKLDCLLFRFLLIASRRRFKLNKESNLSARSS